MNISDTSNPEDSGIQDEEAVQMIIDLDAECGDYCSRDDALSTWNIMDAGQRREMMEEISGRTPYYGSYS